MPIKIKPQNKIIPALDKLFYAITDEANEALHVTGDHADMQENLHYVAVKVMAFLGATIEMDIEERSGTEVDKAKRLDTLCRMSVDALYHRSKRTIPVCKAPTGDWCCPPEDKQWGVE